MAIELTTGTPGAGKTLYTVSEVLRPLVGQTVEVGGRAVPRRLCIAGIPDLLVQHELVEAPPINPEVFADPWGEVVRRPGDPPVTHARNTGVRWVAAAEHETGAVPVPMLAENWWLWCRPGDVLVIDECQTVLRPMAAGRRAPAFIRHLEVHRHYGLDVVLITQHPQLLHSAVRALVGKHRHVRRLFGRAAAIVYEWDHCSPPERVRNATSQLWRYKRAAFGLYKSAQVHTKQKFRLGFALFALLGALVITPAVWWFALQRGPFAQAEPEPATPAPAPILGAAPPPAGGTPAAAPIGSVGGSWPRYVSEPVELQREPLADLAVVIEGEVTHAGRTEVLFGLWAQGQRVGSVRLGELMPAGYSWHRLALCMGSLRWMQVERVVSCGPRPAAPAIVAPPPASPPAPQLAV